MLAHSGHHNDVDADPAATVAQYTVRGWLLLKWFTFVQLETDGKKWA